MSKRDLASIVAAAPAKPSFADSVMVRVDLIDVPTNRLRPADPDYVALYADKLNAGEEPPAIEVRPRDDRAGRYWLIAGLHRLDSHKVVGRAEIPARIFVIGEAEARLREIGENLHRAELSVLDRAINLAELKRVHEELHPELRHGGKRRNSSRQNGDLKASMRFTAEAADRTGLSERAVQRAVALADALSPKAIELIRGTYLSDHGSDLQALARLREDEQVRAAKAIAGGKAKTLKDSLTALGRGEAPVDEQERLFQAVVAAWSRCNAKTRKRVLSHINNGGKGNGEAARQEPKKTRA